VNDIVQFNLTDITPDRDSVFENLGYTKEKSGSEKILDLFIDATEVFNNSVRALGMIHNLTTYEFGDIYEGKGQNDAESPLMQIFPQADYLALFALTLGEKISRIIEDLFKKNDFPLGYMLDTIASLAADKAAKVLEDLFYEDLLKLDYSKNDTCVLSYSPGYCGWHISGQNKLFRYLSPKKIGISLNDSYLMTPLKSVSGVLIAGNKEIHMFSSTFPFCQYCKTYSCHQRIQKLYSL
jgi:hypothetical protein